MQELRFKKLPQFEKALARRSKDLSKLFAYILRIRSRQVANTQQSHKVREQSCANYEVDYDKLIRLIP